MTDPRAGHLTSGTAPVIYDGVFRRMLTPSESSSAAS
jgi:hypothetical protein